MKTLTFIILVIIKIIILGVQHLLKRVPAAVLLKPEGPGTAASRTGRCGPQPWGLKAPHGRGSFPETRV